MWVVILFDNIDFIISEGASEASDRTSFYCLLFIFLLTIKFNYTIINSKLSTHAKQLLPTLI